MSEPKLTNTFAPLPTTQRGYGLHLNVHAKDQRLIYATGRLVVLRSLANPLDVLTFTEHKANVTVAVPSPSGFWVASGDDDGNVLIWAYPSMKLKTQYKIGKTVKDLDWDADSTRLVCAGDGTNKAKVISWDSGNSLGEITMHDRLIISCSYRKHRPFRIATSSEDLTVNFYEGPPFKYKDSFRGHSRYPNCVRYSPDGELLVSVGADSKIVVFDAKTYEVKREIDEKTDGAHKGAIYAMAWAPDSRSIITASADKTVKQWNVSEGTNIHTWTIGSDTLDQQVGCAWTGSFIVSVSLSGAINYLDPASTSVSRALHGHQNTIQSLIVNHSINKIYTSSLTGEVCEWDRATGECQWLSNAKGHGGKVVVALTLNPSANQLYTFGLDDKMRISDLATKTFINDGVALGGQPIKAATSTDGELTVVLLAQDKAVLVRNNGASVATVPLSFTPTALTLSNNGKHVYIGGKDKRVHCYEVNGETLTPVKELDPHLKPLTALSLNADMSRFASSDTEASLFLHSLTDYTLLNKSGWRFHQAGIQDIAYSPNGATLASVSRDNSLIVWHDVITGQDGSKRVKVTNAHSQSVDGVAWADANTIVTYSADKTIKIWTV